MRQAALAVLPLFVVAVAAGCGADKGARVAEPAPEAHATAPAPAEPTPPPAEPTRPAEPAPPASEPAPLSPPSPPAQPVPPTTTDAPPAEPACPTSGTVRAVGDNNVAFAGIAKRSFLAYHRPGSDVLTRFDAVNANGYVTVTQIRGLVKDDCGMLWYYAALPMRPNGVAGFVAARDVRVVKVHTRIVVDLSARELVLYRDGEPAVRSRIAVGAPATPTPTGRYYVNQRLIASDPGGPWGPAALGVSAFSDVLQEWSQGGPIGIHGTNEPSSIGVAASHGCIRLPNHVLLKVFRATDAGTPVIIKG
jgi:L,D-transpeptidase catalytic domain